MKMLLKLSHRNILCQTSRLYQTSSCLRQVNSVENFLDLDNVSQYQKALEAGDQDRILCDVQGLMSRQTLVNVRESVLHNAGVLILFCTVKKEPALLYTLRSQRLGSHAGQISFPGGVSDRSDNDVVATALRETREEIGLSSDGITLWGCGASVPSRHFKHMVTPVVAHCGELDLTRLKPNTREVEEIFTIPVSRLCESSHWSYTRFRIAETRSRHQTSMMNTYIMPVFTGCDHRIWGLTAMFTYLMLRTVASELFQYRVPGDR